MANEPLWSDKQLRAEARNIVIGQLSDNAVYEILKRMRDELTALRAKPDAQADVWQPVEYSDIYTPQAKPIRNDYENICEKWHTFNESRVDADDGYEYAICRKRPAVTEADIEWGVRKAQELGLMPDAQGDVWVPVPDGSLRYHAGLESYMLDGQPIDFFSLPENIAICHRTAPVEAQPTQADEWTPVEYDDIYTPQGEPIRIDYENICEKWYIFGESSCDTDDGYEYAICRKRPQAEAGA